jgi:hypothetical protein
MMSACRGDGSLEKGPKHIVFWGLFGGFFFIKICFFSLLNLLTTICIDYKHTITTTWRQQHHITPHADTTTTHPTLHSDIPTTTTCTSAMSLIAATTALSVPDNDNKIYYFFLVHFSIAFVVVFISLINIK